MAPVSTTATSSTTVEPTISNSLTVIDESVPRLVLLAKPEDLILPAIVSENMTLVVGSRKAMEHGLADGSVPPEVEDERWLLGLDDKKLSASQFVIYFDSLSRRWKVDIPIGGSSTLWSSTDAVGRDVFATSPVDVTQKVLIPVVVEIGCGSANGARKKDIRVHNLMLPSVDKAAHRGQATYVPYGRVNSSDGQYDVLNRFTNNCSGSFGTVFKVQNVVTNMMFAMKCPKTITSEKIEAIRKELHAYLELGCHPNIVHLESFFVEKEIPHMIMSWAEEGSLDKWLCTRSPAGKKNAAQLPPRLVLASCSADAVELLSPNFMVCRVVDVMLQLADALAFAHSRGFVHADVKPENVLVVGTHTTDAGLTFLNVKLCDFGICGVVTPVEYLDIPASSAGDGTRKYQSPEQSASGDRIIVDSKTDVWSFALFSAELLGKCMAPLSQRSTDLRDAQFNTELKEFMSSVSTCRFGEHLIGSLQTALEPSPHLRPSMITVVGGLVRFCEANVLGLNSMEIYDFVVVRHDAVRFQILKTTSLPLYMYHKLHWEAQWCADVCGNVEAADEIHQVLLSMAPQLGDMVYGNYAMFLEQKQGDLVKAESFYLMALKTQPNNAQLLYNLADMYFRDNRGNARKALPLLMKAVKVDPNHVISMGSLASVYEELEDFVNAEKCYLRALELDAGSPVRLCNYALFLEQYKQDYKKASVYYLKSLAIQPDYEPALFNYGDLLETMNDPPGAEKIYLRLLEVNRNHTAGLSNLGQLVMQSGRFPQAEELFKRALSVDPVNVPVLCNYGQLMYQLKRPPTACMEMYNRILTIEPTHSHAFCCMGQCQMYLVKDMKAAACYFEKSIKSNPKNHGALFHYGTLLMNINPLDGKGLKMLERADIAVGHTSPEIQTALRQARTVAAMGASGFQAQPAAPPASADDFAVCQILKEEGNALFKAKNFEAAIAKYVRASLLLTKQTASTKVRDLKLSLNLNIAACHTSRLSWDKVIMYCDKALEIDPRSCKALYRRAIANEANGNSLLAFDDIKKCKQCSGNVVDTSVSEAYSRIELAVLERGS
eukprot:gene29558-36625_t